MKVKKITENLIEVDGTKYIKEESKEWLDIPELGISVEKEVHDKNKSFNELGLKDREDELLNVGECIFLANSKYIKELKMDGSSTTDDFFIQQPFDLNRKNGYVARFCSGSGGSYFVCGVGSDCSYSCVGCRFKKKLAGK